jgi:uncharacterized membrane protein YagU involved in acid resistance
MTTKSISNVRSTSLTKQFITGAAAGLAGGLVFGLLMGIMGMLPMVGMLAGTDSALVGFVVHMGISALLGAVFGLSAARFLSGIGAAAAAGVIYGVIWWVLGALILMPLMLGMNEMVLAIGQPQWMSLMGHILYGVVTALVLSTLSSKL